MSGKIQEGSNSIYLFEPDPNRKTCTLSMQEKYPDLCRNIGWNLDDELKSSDTSLQATR